MKNTYKYIDLSNVFIGIYIILFSIINQANIKLENNSDFNFLLFLPIALCGFINSGYRFIIYLLLILPILFYDFYLFTVLFFLVTIYSIKNIKINNNFLVKIIYFSLFLSILVDIIFNDSSFIYNDHWGRYRLLLGYFHPKEIGQLFVLLILFQPFANKKNILYLIFSYFIDSRNSFLSGIFLLLGRSRKLYLYIAFIFLIILFLIFYNLYRDFLNILLSFRLDYWSSSHENTRKFIFEWPSYFDNSYLTIYWYNKSIFLIFILFLFLNKKVNFIYLIPMLSYVFFDDGLFSFGAPLPMFLLLFSLNCRLTHKL
ncbi:hypothetical protein DPM16_01725 [Polynucleobacter paneuropaeus]|nr:hypothetical protein DPM16_01725 [Polynucleobacter paneuropaeus]